MSCVGGQCVVKPFARASDDALIRGFAVSEFELAQSGDIPGTFSWRAPAGSSRVVCALLTSSPEFSAANQGTLSLVRMTNASQAIQRRRVFNTVGADPQQDFTFTLADLELDDAATPQCPAALSIPNRFPGQRYPVVAMLGVGCWAFNEVKVIAATSLISIAPSRLPAWSTTPASTCRGHADGIWCRTLEPGTCQRQRCDTSLPPKVPDPMLDAAGAGGQLADIAPAIQDCTRIADGTACAVPGTVGQCLSEGCVTPQDGVYRPPLVVSDCSADFSDGLNCYPSPILDFGNCSGGSCQLRCWKPDDCVNALMKAGLPGANSTCTRDGAVYLATCARGDVK